MNKNNKPMRAASQFLIAAIASIVSLMPLYLTTPTSAACPVINRQPVDASGCPSGVAQFSVTAQGDPPLSYRWQIEISPGIWNTMGNDPMPLSCPGAAPGAFAFASNPFSNNSPIGVHPCPGVQSYRIRCVVTNDCGSVNSNPATWSVCCNADITGNSVVNVDDLLAVINSWGQCAIPPTPCPADIAPPGGNGVVNVDDLLAVINAWGPCP